MKIDPNKPISSLYPKLIDIQKSLLSGKMCETDLYNWFFDFCSDIKCPDPEKVAVGDVETTSKD